MAEPVVPAVPSAPAEPPSGPLTILSTSPVEGYHRLMSYRVQRILLVASHYDCYVLEEDASLTERLLTEYLELNIRYAPRVWRVTSAREAMEVLAEYDVDLVITMMHLVDMDGFAFARRMALEHADVPVVLLAYNSWQLGQLLKARGTEGIDRVFIWHGDTKILLAIIKCIEDRANVAIDCAASGGNVRVILLIEDSIAFYSIYLPLFYTELMRQMQAAVHEGLNLAQKLLRNAARPKVLLAQTFEEAEEIARRYKDSLLGVISDMRFPRAGRMEARAGYDFLKALRAQMPDLPLLLQSSEAANEALARELKVSFVNKRSPTLLHDLRAFMLDHFGFGDFVFRLPDGAEVARARDVRDLERKLATVPEASVGYHAGRHHFSNWLRARAEFELAQRLRPFGLNQFATVAEVRGFLIKTFREFREESQRGVVADFSRARYDSTQHFLRVGGGSLGGKARGLAFMDTLLKSYRMRDRFPGVTIAVPRTLVIGTDVFDDFLDSNDLLRLALSDAGDERVVKAFLDAKLPAALVNDLRAFVENVEYPLAVRSSSLLEDSHFQPFAGVYATHMLPNTHRHAAVRAEQLGAAVRLVYASTFLRATKAYLAATPYRLEEEKMAVAVQEMVGRRRGDAFYPCFAGVAASYNYYPFARMRPEDGVAFVALGLGRTVVDGGRALRFCPAYPQVLPQFGTADDLLQHTQHEFYALDLTRAELPPSTDEAAPLVRFDLGRAEADGVLDLLGSVYSPENDCVYEGVDRPGVRVVNFAPVLKHELLPLAAILRALLELARQGLAGPVEIEFAVDCDPRRPAPARFGFLQVRPLAAGEDHAVVELDAAPLDHLIGRSTRSLGNGRYDGLTDLVYVRPEAFQPEHTPVIAREVAAWNERLAAERRPYVLIGPGRWGSADRWLGIPVQWAQIAGARVIVEAALEHFRVEPSQGTHFFQNLTAFRIGYLTVNPTTDGEQLDWDWLARQPAVEETRFLRRLRFERPLVVRIDGRSRQGLIGTGDAQAPPPAPPPDPYYS